MMDFLSELLPTEQALEWLHLKMYHQVISSIGPFGKSFVAIDAHIGQIVSLDPRFILEHIQSFLYIFLLIEFFLIFESFF